jgi:hypothetical protein
VYGVRPKRLFREAATKFLLENQHKRSIRSDGDTLKILDAYIGDLNLEAIHMGTLQTYLVTRQKEGVKNRTINYGLQVTRHILNLAASEWMSENDARKPYSLDWEEQDRSFAALPRHLQEMALFAVNTGCRDRVKYANYAGTTWLCLIV